MSEKRSQFTFYRSYWEAMKSLGKRDRQAILEAVIGYALDGQVAEGLSSLQMAMFSLIKPTLDTARRKSIGGKYGGQLSASIAAESRKDAARIPQGYGKDAARIPKGYGKDAARIPQGCRKDTPREKENEMEAEIEKEADKEKEYESREAGFGAFWQAYPVKIGENEARAAWNKVQPDPQAVLAGLEKWKSSEQWGKDGGMYIPRGAKFLLSGYWKELPRQAGTGQRTLDADEEAAIRRMMEEENDAGTP